MFPSVINTFNIVAGTDRLNSPSHSALHNSVSSVVTQMQTVIGTDSSALGTIIGDLRNPNSGGGGHVQTAVKGGTGQTTFTKGDLLVATSSSVLSKLAVGSDNQLIVADSTTAAGLKWATNPNSNKIGITTTSVSASRGAISVATVLYATSILGSTLGVNNAIKFTGEVRTFQAFNDFIAVVNYGNNVVASVTVAYESGVGNSILGASGTINGMIVSNNSSVAQLGFVNVDLSNRIFGATNTKGPAIAMGTGSGNSSINSTSDQNLVITGRFADAANNSILAGFFVVEKIS